MIKGGFGAAGNPQRPAGTLLRRIPRAAGRAETGAMRAGAYRARCTLLIVGLLAATTAVACSKDETEHATVTAAGGRVGPGGRFGQLDVPAGAASGSVEVTFALDGSGEHGSPGGYAEPVGKAVSIKPAEPLAGAQVRLPFDQAKDLPAGATTTNVFIAVFNETLTAWIPLPTTYDAAAGQVV